MKTCINCHKSKNDREFKKSGHSKDGLRNKCIECELMLKNKKKSKSKYRKTFKLVNPANPIPVKLTTMDGFGGYYKFDINKLDKDHIQYMQDNGLKNHMVNRKFKCWQVKDANKVNLAAFCHLINMSTDAIITFDKPDNTVYVVNLFHPAILSIMK